jgi:hypothetical protein
MSIDLDFTVLKRPTLSLNQAHLARKETMAKIARAKHMAETRDRLYNLKGRRNNGLRLSMAMMLKLKG